MVLLAANVGTPPSAHARNLCTPSEQRTAYRLFNNMLSSVQVMAQPWTKNHCNWAKKYARQSERLGDWFAGHPECLRPGGGKILVRYRSEVKRMQRKIQKACG